MCIKCTEMEDIMKKEFYYPSSNGKNQIYAVIWKPVSPIKAIVQISHGMVEYINRYEEFALFLNSKGILVVGNDHMGHGRSVNSEKEWGYFASENASHLVVKDLYHLTCIIRKKYPNCPYFLLGHSMGSFLARRYLMTYGNKEKNKLDGAILIGTGNQSKYSIYMGMALVKFAEIFRKETYKSNWINNCVFGLYNKKIAHPKSAYDWISRNEENVKKYQKDKACTFIFTLNGFQMLFSTLLFIENKNNIARISKTLPILLLAGEEDPVGNYGRAIKEIYHIYKRYGIQDIGYKLYEKDRHEILNEVDRMDIYQDILDWILEKI